MTKKITHFIPLSIGEIFKKLEVSSNKSERALILQENDHPALRAILRLNFDPNISFELPTGTPEKYRPNPNPIGFGGTHIKGIYKKFYIFTKNGSLNLRQSKRETIFLQTLEQLDNYEAKLLVDAKDKKLDFGLTKKLIDEVFPGLLPGDVLETSGKEITSEPVVAEPVIETQDVPKVKKTKGKNKKDSTNEAQSTSEGV